MRIASHVYMACLFFHFSPPHLLRQPMKLELIFFNYIGWPGPPRITLSLLCSTRIPTEPWHAQTLHGFWGPQLESLCLHPLEPSPGLPLFSVVVVVMPVPTTGRTKEKMPSQKSSVTTSVICSGCVDIVGIRAHIPFYFLLCLHVEPWYRWDPDQIFLPHVY